MKPRPFLLLHVYFNNFIFALFSGIQLWGSLYTLLKATKGSFTALSGLLTSLVVLHLPQVSMTVKEFSTKKPKWYCISSVLCPAGGTVPHT